MKNAILLILLICGLFCAARPVDAQIITGSASYSFTQPGVINIDGTDLLLEAYDGTDGGVHNDWVVSPGMEGRGGPELQYAQTSAQWLSGGPIAFGTWIGSSGVYSGNFSTSDSSFSDVYYGIDYTVAPGDVEYGWAELSYDSASGTDTIVAAALDTNANESIQAGAVPEPATCALLVFGAAAGYAMRRKKHSAN